MRRICIFCTGSRFCYLCRPLRLNIRLQLLHGKKYDLFVFCCLHTKLHNWNVRIKSRGGPPPGVRREKGKREQQIAGSEWEMIILNICIQFVAEKKKWRRLLQFVFRLPNGLERGRRRPRVVALLLCMWMFSRIYAFGIFVIGLYNLINAECCTWEAQQEKLVSNNRGSLSGRKQLSLSPQWFFGCRK